jgi:hypothetical protein
MHRTAAPNVIIEAVRPQERSVHAAGRPQKISVLCAASHAVVAAEHAANPFDVDHSMDPWIIVRAGADRAPLDACPVL